MSLAKRRAIARRGGQAVAAENRWFSQNPDAAREAASGRAGEAPAADAASGSRGRQISAADREVGARVRARRRECGISQTRIGQALGVSYQQIQKYEKGVDRLSLSSLVLIAEVLGCSPLDLLSGSDEMTIDWVRHHQRDRHEAFDAFSRIRDHRVRAAVFEFLKALAGE